MKVSIVRRGGFAGLVTTTTVDSAALPAEQDAELRARVSRSGLLDLPARAGGPGPGADLYDYEVRVEDRGGARTVRIGERELTGPLRDLVGYVASLPGATKRTGPPGQ
ncbi:hypothetical protein Misp01_46530 [Microtetraspora sp. NBRC 13810]|uniref:protealysin inhibitor emfourin n=1 Tax=Microtetraspora sp. NBRC 13810 TaxID=3030990 RepID=UPI0024A49173|nr:protealysin inhibitor emfourin [Microtetraspora sp. NBRC 13810]GLW09524.1 hypothetical protein Misp01_46530 [Microtetraspora sp. NBRC 13810]